VDFILLDNVIHGISHNAGLHNKYNISVTM